MTQRPHNLDNLRNCPEIVSHSGIGDPLLKPGRKIAIRDPRGPIEGFALGTAVEKATGVRVRAWVCTTIGSRGIPLFAGWTWTYVRNDFRRELAEAEEALRKQAESADTIRKWPEIVSHPKIDNPSLNPGYMVGIQGRTASVEGFALGTAEYDSKGERIRMWAGVLRDENGLRYLMGFTTTYVSDEGAQEAKDAEAALRALANGYVSQPDGGYH